VKNTKMLYLLVCSTLQIGNLCWVGQRLSNCLHLVCMIRLMLVSLLWLHQFYLGLL